MQFVEIRCCIEDLHSCSVSSSALIHEIALAVEASISWSEPFGHTCVVVCHIPTDFYIPPVYSVDGD